MRGRGRRIAEDMYYGIRRARARARESANRERERQCARVREIKQGSRYHDGTSTLLWLACLGFRLFLGRDFRSIDSIGDHRGSTSVCSQLPSPGRMYFDERFCPSFSRLASRAACLGVPGDLSRHPHTHKECHATRCQWETGAKS